MSNESLKTTPPDVAPEAAPPITQGDKAQTQVTAAEAGGPKGLEPTRYGDWERKGKCVDF
ncbi:MAG: DUF1674 domain-containing protein [Alphaproteobacteria bacterium]|nr:DUF1674 domain-containing protein [Alphaproteobacteria bacterium]MBV8548263.1 DUF1674 domain-containing protein [Alphaproteobacteria bacterium]